MSRLIKAVGFSVEKARLHEARAATRAYEFGDTHASQHYYHLGILPMDNDFYRNFAKAVREEDPAWQESFRLSWLFSRPYEEFKKIIKSTVYKKYRRRKNRNNS